MSERKMGKPNYSFDEKRMFSFEIPETPGIEPGPKKTTKSEFSQKELEAMCKKPRESAELIRYLIEIIKSL
jgi:hypothetical protein